jgi:hypothetical protein
MHMVTVEALPSKVNPVAPSTALVHNNPSGEIRCTMGPATNRRANIKSEV